jgi:thiamine-phosphate pyrophosphorylase
MELIVITPEISVANEVAIVNQMLMGGLRHLHVRKPGFTDAEYGNYITGIDAGFRERIVIHGVFHIYEELKLGGIHLSSFSRNDEQLQQTIRHIPPSVISTSFHSWAEIEENTFPYRYVFISPVFDSISKTGYKAAIDLGKAAEVKRNFKTQNRYCPQIIGLGGVDMPQLEVLRRHGFDGAAMLGAVWGEEDKLGKVATAISIANRLTTH